jgi:hypothetical protein
MANAGQIDPLMALAQGICVVKAVDKLPKGHVRLETRFFYPDRSAIDLFIKNPMQTGDKLILTDMGYTTSWLSDVLVKPWQSKKRARFVEDALRVLDVHQEGGALATEFTKDPGSLVDAIVRLGQACVRVADLTFTRRSALQVYAAEEVEEILTDADLPYEPNAELPVRGGNIVTVDFLVHGRKRDTALITLLPDTQGAAHSASVEVFRKMYDLQVSDRIEQRISVYNDKVNVYRTEDLDRLMDVSDLIGISHRDELQGRLAA